MLTLIRRAVLISVVLIVVCGLAYPALMVGLGQAFFHGQANGSLVSDNGRAIGSDLIGQHWNGPKWFQGRPDEDDALASGGTNLGPRSAALVKSTRAVVERLEEQGITPTNDLVTTSFSELDPDISPADAEAQVDSVARARDLPVAVVRSLVARESHGAALGFLGAPYVDVLDLNEALARLS